LCYITFEKFHLAENIPRKKPVTIEDQYAYDAQGRRRFHGAFTGGFSAGYFNTVGTRDGWRPQQFKSSRSSKADNVVQRPEDFMDEEDTSLFGIAPKGIRATSDYADHGQRGKKRERISQEGPIPGTPILKELLKPVKLVFAEINDMLFISVTFKLKLFMIYCMFVYKRIKIVVHFIIF